MKRALVLIVLLAGCATAPSPVEQAREYYSAGRGDEALTVLEQAMRQRPGDQGLRREYFRLRDTLASTEGRRPFLVDRLTCPAGRKRLLLPGETIHLGDRAWLRHPGDARLEVPRSSAQTADSVASSGTRSNLHP